MSAPSSISRVSIKNAMLKVDRSDPATLIEFLDQLEKVVADSEMKSKAISGKDITEREVLEIMGLSNSYTDWGQIREYDIPKIQVKASVEHLIVSEQVKEILDDIVLIWPPCNKSNVRVLITMVVHFVVVQINKEIRSSQDLGGSLSPKSSPLPLSSTSLARSPFSSTAQSPFAVSTPFKKSEGSGETRSLISLKSYTEVLVSLQTTNTKKEKATIRGFIDYGISYAQSSPEALDTFFAVVEAKAMGKLTGPAWAQLLCYMAIIQKRRKTAGKTNVTVYGCLTDGIIFQFARIGNNGQPSRSKPISIVKELNTVFRFFSQILRAIVRSSPTSSPSNLSDITTEVLTFETSIEPNYIFEVLETPGDDIDIMAA